MIKSEVKDAGVLEKQIGKLCKDRRLLVQNLRKNKQTKSKQNKNKKSQNQPNKQNPKKKTTSPAKHKKIPNQKASANKRFQNVIRNL